VRRFKPGVGLLALRLGVPVIPVWLGGTARAFPKGAFWPRPCSLQVRIGAPLLPDASQEQDAAGSDSKRFAQLVEDKVRELGSARHGPWALVTGASSGLGAALSLELAQRGFNLLITARRADELEGVAQQCRDQHTVNVVVQACDIGTADGRQQLLARLGECGEIRLLVNNAGMGAYSWPTRPDAARHQALLALNVDAPVALTDALLPGMLARGNGMILNVGSVYSVVPAPGQGVYSGSKAFVRSWSRALQKELHGTGVSVTLALPGSFESGFHGDMGLREGRKLAKLPATRVAAVVVTATLRRRRTSVPGSMNWLFLVVCTPLPQRCTAAVMSWLNKLRKLKPD
jgi:short-subunit dehydrogenase